jgi:CheY-like chemotaxis protein
MVLMDLCMRVMDGIEATSRIRTERPDVRVIVLSSLTDRERVDAGLRAGALGYLPKEPTPSSSSAPSAPPPAATPRPPRPDDAAARHGLRRRTIGRAWKRAPAPDSRPGARRLCVAPTGRRSPRGVTRNLRNGRPVESRQRSLGGHGGGRAAWVLLLRCARARRWS